MTSKKYYVSVNKHTIASNLKHDKDDPPVRIQHGKSGKGVYCRRFRGYGPYEIVYSGNDKPVLKCGARIVMIFDNEPEILE